MSLIESIHNDNNWSKSRKWVFTFNNYTEDDYERLRSDTSTRWLVVGREVGESGTPHLQGAVVFPNARSFASVCRWVGGRAHVEPMRGSFQDNYDYCTKDGKFIVVEPKFV